MELSATGFGDDHYCQWPLNRVWTISWKKGQANAIRHDLIGHHTIQSAGLKELF